MITAYQILHLEAETLFYVFGTGRLFSTVLIFDKGKADEVLGESSSAVFFVYSGVNFEKLLLGKDLLFKGFRVTI